MSEIITEKLKRQEELINKIIQQVNELDTKRRDLIQEGVELQGSIKTLKELLNEKETDGPVKPTI